jgi:hypothetical protein
MKRAAAVAFIVLLGVSLVLGVRLFRDTSGSIPFTRDAWAEADPETRGRMVKDLLTRYNLEGMSREEVEALLGPGPYDIGHMGRDPHAIFAFTYEMYFEFDAAGRVKKVVIND